MESIQRKTHILAKPGTGSLQRPCVEQVYNVEAMEGRRKRLNLSHEDIRAECRRFGQALSRPTVAAALNGDPKSKAGTIRAVMNVLGLDWSDLVIPADRKEGAA